MVRELRRKRRLSAGFQFRALLPVIIYCVLLIVLGYVFVVLPLGRDIAADPSPVVKALLSAQLFRIELSLVPFLLIPAGVAATYALLRARRLAAPVLEVKEGLAKLAVGEAQPLALEPHDEFRDLEAPFNAVVSRIDQMVRTNLEMLRLLRRNLEGISQRAANHQLSDADLRESLAVLLRDVDSEIKKIQMRS